MSWFVRYMPFVIVGVVGGTSIITFYLSYFHFEHVTYILPYISDTGTFPPESCVFAQGLSIASMLMGFATYLKYLQVKEICEKHHIDKQFNLNKVAFGFALVASIGVNFVANFQETNAIIFHWFAAILAFGGGSIYVCLQSLLYLKIAPVIGQRKTTIFRILISLIAILSFIGFTASAFVAYGKFKGDDFTKWKKEDGGSDVHQLSTITEWICAVAIMMYISLFQKEFAKISVIPLSVVLEELKDESE